MKTARENPTAAPDLESLVLDWQGRIYDLARRLLGNEADAADATQEVFARLFRKLHRLDSRRDPAPWIYRVATNVIRNHARARGRHRMEGRDVSDIDSPAGPDHRDLENELRDRLADLPSDERAAVVLHYYHGLSQVEVARVLSIPRTTVQSRIGRALESMRTGLLASGALFTFAEMTAAMQGARYLQAPADLSTTLLSMAQVAAPAAATTGTVLGGMIMTKQLIGAAVLVGAISLGLGFAAGKANPFGGDDTPELARTTHVTASAYDALEQRHDEAARKLRSAEAELAAERERRAAAAAELESLRAEAERRPAGNGDAEAAELGEDTAEQIDWSRFSELFARNLDIMASSVGKEETHMSSEDQAAIASMMAEVMKLTAQARSMSEDPFTDDRILPGLMSALFGESVELTDAQRGHLETLAGRELASMKASLEPDATAIERYRARLELVSTVNEGLSSSLRADQLDRFGTASRVAAEVLNGNYSRASVGLGADPAIEVTPGIVNHWDHAYSFTDEQRAQASRIADEYRVAAEETLRRHGRWGDGLGPADASIRARLDEEMYSLQLAHEKRISALVTPQQRRQSLQRTPRIFIFQYGRGISTHTHQGPGI